MQRSRWHPLLALFITHLSLLALPHSLSSLQLRLWSPLQVAIDARDWELAQNAARSTARIARRSFAPNTPPLSELLALTPLLHDMQPSLSAAEAIGGQAASAEVGAAFVLRLLQPYGPSNHKLQPRHVRQRGWLLLCIDRRVALEIAAKEERMVAAAMGAASAEEGDDGSPGHGAGDSHGPVRRPSWRRRLSSVSTWMRRPKPAPALRRAPPLEIWCEIIEALAILEEGATGAVEETQEL